MLDTETLSSCRTCMKNDKKLIYLYESVIDSDDSNNPQLVQILMECTTIQVTEDDGMPQNICNDCSNFLRNVFMFRQQAIQADNHFKMLLENVKHEIKIETDTIYKSDHEQDHFDTINDFDTDLNDCPIKQETNILKCNQCNRTYTKEKRYLKHLQTHTLAFPCPYCDEKFQTELSWQNHLSDHEPSIGLLKQSYTTVVVRNENGTEELKYQCLRCGKCFSKTAAITTHLKKHESKESCTNEQFMCDQCNKSFDKKPLLRRHLKVHLDKCHKCTECDKSYTRSDQLRYHMNTHKDNKTNVCPHCSKAFSQICSLKDHIRTHTKETPYLCSECGKGFANSSNLRQHMLRHAGVKPYQCKLCPKSFCTKGQMTSHMVTHTGAHPYKCEKCGSTFTKPNSLKKHAMIHSGQRPFGCDTCEMRFTCKDHLKRHYRIHTGEKPYKCKYCSRAFTQSNDLVKHMRTHLGQNIYSCSVCGVSFRLQSELKQHYPVHFSDDRDPTVKSLLEQTERNFEKNLLEHEKDVKKNLLEEGEQRLLERDNVGLDVKQNMMHEKFMITINSVDGNNIVAINIEPESNMLKV